MKKTETWTFERSMTTLSSMLTWLRSEYPRWSRWPRSSKRQKRGSKQEGSLFCYVFKQSKSSLTLKVLIGLSMMMSWPVRPSPSMKFIKGTWSYIATSCKGHWAQRSSRKYWKLFLERFQTTTYLRLETLRNMSCSWTLCSDISVSELFLRLKVYTFYVKQANRHIVNKFLY